MNATAIAMKGKVDELFFDSYEKYYEDLLKKNNRAIRTVKKYTSQY